MTPLVLLVGLTIALGLVIDRFGGVWGPPLVSLWVWGLGGLLWWRERAWRPRLLACLVIATAGEVVLSLVWGLYDYRLSNLPLFVPPGHVLLYWLGLRLADGNGELVLGVRSQASDSTRVLVVRQIGGSVGLLVDEVLGQRSFSEDQLAASVGEADENFGHFVGESVQLGDIQWGLFSMAALVRSPQFQQAAA